MIQAVQQNGASPPTATVISRLDTVRLVALLALLSVRPVIGETFEPVQVSMLAALQVDVGPTPAATAWLDLLTLAVAADTLLTRGRWRQRGPVTLGLVLLLLAVVLSSWHAGSPPLALLMGASLVIAVLAGAALCSLLRTRWVVNLTVAAMLAGGVTTAVKCGLQRYVDNPQTQRQWETVYKPDLIRQGFDPDSPMMVNFERRMLAADAYGFLGHPNITGSCLALWTLVALGLLRRTTSVFPLLVVLVLTVMLGAALWFTASRGGLAAAAFGLVVVVVLTRRPEWFARHARPVLAGLAGLYLAVVAGVATYAIVRGTLPHPSLEFRWYYWTTAVRAYEDAPLTGIGRGSFGAAYTRYKPAESTEEVRDPHNVWVSLLTELGPLGLIGGVVLCAVCVRAGLRSLQPAQWMRATATVSPPVNGPPTFAVLAVIGVPLALHALFSGTPLGHPGMAIVWAQEIVAPWLFAVLLTLWLLGRTEAPATAHHSPPSQGGVGGGSSSTTAAASRHPSRHTNKPDGSPAATTADKWVGAGLCAALLAALLHGLVDFALLTPGGLAVFVLCAAAAGGLAGAGVPAAGPESGRRRGLLAAVAGLAVLAHGLGITLPAMRTASGLNELRLAATTPPPAGPQAVLTLAREIEQRQPRDTVLSRTAAQTLLRIATGAAFDPRQELEWLTTAYRLAELACARNPHDTTNYAALAAVAEELAWYREGNGDAEQRRQAWTDAVAAWERAVELYPTNPRTRLSAGRAWLELWQHTGEPAHAERARDQFQAALEIDDRRPPGDTVRLRAKELEQIAEGLRKLDAASRTGTGANEK